MGRGAWRSAVQGPKARDAAEVSQLWEGVVLLLESCCL